MIKEVNNLLIISKVFEDTVYIAQIYPIKAKDNKGEWYETDSDWLDLERKQGNQTHRLKIPLDDFTKLLPDIEKLIADAMKEKS